MVRCSHCLPCPRFNPSLSCSSIVKETTRQAEARKLLDQGLVPHNQELQAHPEKFLLGKDWLMGEGCALIEDVLSALEIVEGMVKGAVGVLEGGYKMLGGGAKF